MCSNLLLLAHKCDDETADAMKTEAQAIEMSTFCAANYSSLLGMLGDNETADAMKMEAQAIEVGQLYCLLCEVGPVA